MVTLAILCSFMILPTTEAFVPFSTHSYYSKTRIFSVASEPAISTDVLQKQTVTQLKEELKASGLPVSGTKAILIQRLLENKNGFVQDDNEEEEFASEENVSLPPPIEQATEVSLKTASLEEPIVENDDDSTTDTTSSAVLDILPPPLFQTLTKKTASEHPTLLPVQERAYRPISSGSDAVLFAPTGSGKTLGYVLPLFAQWLEWKKAGKLPQRKRKRLGPSDYYTQQKEEACTPSILILVPSRELAKQVGKVCAQYHPASSRRVATVFGGVPLERHVAIMHSNVDVVVGTAGRIRELIRKEHLSTEHVRTIVLDEADVLLNFEDQPEIEMLLNGMQEDYQLVLASATINRLVKDFVEDTMEMTSKDENFIVVEGVDGGSRQEDATSAMTTSTSAGPAKHGRPTVQHWSMAARASARSGLAADLVATLAPRVGIIFVAAKAEADAVAEELSHRFPSANHVRVSVLHGDMSQSARSRTVAALRQDSSATSSRILVATDVASRGLDLPGVDLVLQFGIPRESGKEGTCNAELYTHRAGRAGRVGGGSRPADAIVLYDPEQGEGRTMPSLEEELAGDFGIRIRPRPLPSSTDIMEASWVRAKQACEGAMVKQASSEEFSDFFKTKLISETSNVLENKREEELLNRLAAAMAALSGMDGKIPKRSLLTADPRDRTVRVWDDNESLSPPQVTRFVKGLGSGKLGRVTICNDGSAVFDLTEKRALRLMDAAKEQEDSDANDESGSLHVELPSILPEVQK
jgi:superfamily II DNA/RNA helicase